MDAKNKLKEIAKFFYKNQMTYKETIEFINTYNADSIDSIYQSVKEDKKTQYSLNKWKFDKKCVALFRLSKVKNGNEANFVRQEYTIFEYAAKKEYNIVKEFREIISGAKQYNERKVLKEAIGYCIQNDIHTIIISSVDRLSRNVDTLRKIIQICEINTIDLVFVDDNLSLFSKTSKMVDINATSNIIKKCEDAHKEAQLIKDRLMGGRKVYIANGLKLGRHTGSKKTLQQYNEQYSELIDLLNTTNMSIRKLASKCNVSVSTVQRVKKIIEMENSCYDKRKTV